MTPLVSAVMPTANRAAYVPMAIKCFLAQTYANRELVILETGEQDISRHLPDDARIRYYHYSRKARLGDLRNLVCGLAYGSIMIHWDDDDWYAPGRIADQVARLQGSGKAVTGYHRFFYWDEVGRRAYEYNYTGQGHYASGSTQCYFRTWWDVHPFPSVGVSEDSQFSFDAAHAGQLISVPAAAMMVARTHGRNTGNVSLGSHGIPVVDPGLLPIEFLCEVGWNGQDA